MESAPPWQEYELTDTRVVEWGDGGVVVYRAVSRRAGEEPYSPVMSSTSVREGGAWRLAFHQQSPAA